MRAHEYKGWEKSSDMVEIIQPADADLQRVDFIGSGVLLFPVDDLHMIPKPWFGEKFVRETMQRQASMDTRFVWELKAHAGAQIWVDTTLKIGHLNDMEIDDTYQHRFTREDWKEQGYGNAPANVR